MLIDGPDRPAVGLGEDEVAARGADASSERVAASLRRTGARIGAGLLAMNWDARRPTFFAPFERAATKAVGGTRSPLAGSITSLLLRSWLPSRSWLRRANEEIELSLSLSLVLLSATRGLKAVARVFLQDSSGALVRVWRSCKKRKDGEKHAATLHEKGEASHSTGVENGISSGLVRAGVSYISARSSGVKIAEACFAPSEAAVTTLSLERAWTRPNAEAAVTTSALRDGFHRVFGVLREQPADPRAGWW